MKIPNLDIEGFTKDLKGVFSSVDEKMKDLSVLKTEKGIDISIQEKAFNEFQSLKRNLFEKMEELSKNQSR